MTLNDLIPELRALPRTDKLWVIQMMAAEVAREDDTGLPKTGQEDRIWSPFEAFEGAATLMRAGTGERCSMTDEVPFTEENRSALSDEDRDFLLSLLAAPPKANADLKKAARPCFDPPDSER